MAGVSITLDVSHLELLVRRVEQWGHGTNTKPLYRGIGAEIESQTRARIADDRTSPEGNAWQEWSARYAATRQENHKLLQNEGDLMDSLNALAINGQVEVGSNLEYAAAHQFGSKRKKVPARPYLGLSTEDTEDVLDVVTTWIDSNVRRWNG